MSSAPTSSSTRDDHGTKGGRSLVVPIVALVAAMALAVAAFAGGTGDDDAPDGAGAATEASTDAGADDPQAAERAEVMGELERREEGDPLALGDVDAPVLMIEWADFQCPFCGSFARDTKPELVDRYVDEGILRIEWRDFAILGEESQLAALAGRAAAEQDAFWEMHDEIFSEDRPRNEGHLDRDALTAMAGDLGLDTEQFAEDFDDPAHAQVAQEDLQVGQALGITGTPAFLINGRPLIGGQPVDAFIELIEQAAAEAGV